MSDHKTELAVLRDRRVAALRGRLGDPERMSLRFACVVRDIEFTVVLSRATPSARFTCERIEPVAKPPGGGFFVRLFARPQDRLSVPAEQISLGAVRCAGCGRYCGWTQCCGCGAFVCDGRSDGRLFRCRDSCGEAGPTGPLTEVDAARHGPASGPAIGRSASLKSLPKRR